MSDAAEGSARTAPEQPLVRHTVSVAAAHAETALALLLDVFPAGLEEERDGDTVRLSGYRAPGEAPTLPGGLVAAAVPVAPGWRDGWRRFHQPVRVAGFWIGPPWLEPDDGLEAVVIDPGQAFGTGAHGSTQAAVSLLAGLPAAERSGPLADLGCGSGVLAIVAARLGFGPVWALDVDVAAIDATQANAARNGVRLASVAQGDALVDPLPPVPLAVANLQLDLLLPLLRRSDLPPRLIVSGLLEGEPFAPPGWRSAAELRCAGWRAVRLERDPSGTGA